MWLKSHAKFGEASDSATRLSLDLFERVIDVLEKEAGQLKQVPPLSQAEVVVAERTGLQRSGANSTLDDIYGYWKRKRERLKKPLLRRFWPPTQEGNADPHATFRQRSKERYRLRRTRRSDDNDAYRRLAWVRHGLAQALDLLSLVQRREEAKLELVTIAADSFEQAVFEATDTTGTQRRPAVLKNRRFEHRAASAAATRHRSRQRKGQKREARQASAASAAARALYEATMMFHIPGKHAERIASMHGLTAAQAQQHGEAATVGKVPVPFRTGPWRAPFFVPVHPAAGAAFSRWPLAPTAGDPDAARVKFAEGELEDVTGAAMLLAATRDGAAAACSAGTLQAHSGAAARPLPHALSVLAAEFAGRRSVARLRDRGATAPLGVGGTGAGEAAADVLELGAASGVPVGFERDEALLRMQRLGRRSFGDADLWLQQRRAALHVDTTARLRALMLQHRTTNIKPTLGMAAPGSAWEEAAGLALGVGSLGDHGEGWELTGHRPQLRAPDLAEAVEWRLGAAAAAAAVRGRQAGGDGPGSPPLVRLLRSRSAQGSPEPGAGCPSPAATAETEWAEGEEDDLFAALQELRGRPVADAASPPPLPVSAAASGRPGPRRAKGPAASSAPHRRQPDPGPSAGAGARDGACDAHGVPSGAERLSVLQRSRYAAWAAAEAAAAGALSRAELAQAAGRPAPGPAPFITRARVGRGGRVWVDRVLAPQGTELGGRRRAAMADIAARDALQGRAEAEAAAGGGAAAAATAALRAAGFVPPQTGQLSSAVWHSSTRARTREEQLEAQGLSAGLEAEDPGALHACLAAAMGPPSVARGGGEGRSASASWQVRTRLLEEQAAVLVGGGASAVAGRVAPATGEAVAALLPGAASLAGQHGSRGLAAVRRLVGRAGVLSRPATAAGSRQRVSGASGVGPTLLGSTDLSSVAGEDAAGGRAAEADAQGWPWLQSVLRDLPGAPHLAAPATGSHSGLLAQRLGAPPALQHSRPPRARRLDQVYFAPDNAFSLLVEAHDASRAEATHLSGTACPGGQGAPTPATAVLLRGFGRSRPRVSAQTVIKAEPGSSPASADAQDRALSPLSEVEVTGPYRGTEEAADEAYWASAVRAPKPITVLDTTALLAKAATDTS